MAAAVADFRPITPLQGKKINRSAKGLTLELEATPDLLAELSTSKPEHGLRIGWALEPQSRLRDSGRRKLKSKNVHAIVANPLETISDEEITAILLLDDGSERTPPGGTLVKPAFADWLLDEIDELRTRTD
jgi:phosphopantothenoylcysteine decarboxylase/phosphopantothenate--cysteine ligase